MRDYEDLKATLKAALGGVADAARDLASNAGDKAKTLGRIAKLTVEINTEKENAKNAYSEIGKLYYETYRDEPGEFFVQLFDEVTLANEHRAQMEAELTELKASVGASGGDNGFEDVVEADEADAAGPDIEVEIVTETAAPAEPETPAKPETPAEPEKPEDAEAPKDE